MINDAITRGAYQNIQPTNTLTHSCSVATPLLGLVFILCQVQRQNIHTSIYTFISN